MSTNLKWTLSGSLVAKRRRRRKWSDDEKRMICAQTQLSGVSVSQVARRYDVNANQVFNWLKDPKFAPRPEGCQEDGDIVRFLPVEIVEPARSDAASLDVLGEIEIELVGGHRLKVIGAYDPEALVRLIRGLSS